MAKQFPKGLLLSAIGLALLGTVTWQGRNWWLSETAPLLSSNSPADAPINLRVPPGTSAQEIGQDLQALGLIRSTKAWDLWTRWMMFQNTNGGFQAGTYQLSKTQSLPDIASKIWAGKVTQLSFTIPEGWSVREMAQYFEQQGFFTAKEFLTATDRVSSAQYPWLPSTRTTEDFPRLEGYLFPDTYQIASPVDPDAVIQQMLDRFEQVALPLYEQQKGKTTLSLAEWVNLASLVEKEAVVPEERRRIAGVFTNRLQQGMPLASDPTVEYAFGIKQTPDRPLLYREVETPHPYNTYINPGLPPAAIASPGRASLEATLNPENTDYLYFVARYDGTHVFSRTLKDHQAAQNRIHDQRDADKPVTQ
jgi:UPF0755 protein